MGHFLSLDMSPKPAISISDQISLLKSRGMIFNNESLAQHYLKNISYYRLKGYWWDMQIQGGSHNFTSASNFDDVIRRYNFDRHLRLILFDGIERVEIALRTKLIYHMSLSYGPYWYQESQFFSDIDIFNYNLASINRELKRSKEIFIVDHKNRFPNQSIEAFKLLEIISFGTLSKMYKNLSHQLPEKAQIAKEMGLHLHAELSSWLEAIVYLRNIIAHHSRLWSRNMVKKPKVRINNPMNDWLDQPLIANQKKKVFLIASTLIYLCNVVTPNHQVKVKILNLINSNADMPIYKLGFMGDWRSNPIWT